MTVPEIIKQTRKALKMNQTQMARLVWPDKDPAVTQTYLSKYERGISDPPASVFLKIQDLLKHY